LSRVSLFVNDNYLSRDFCIIDEYMWCASFNLFLNKFLSYAFLKHIFKANYLFHSFMYQEQILVLYFLCINDKHFSRVFSIFQRRIFISYFLYITDKYFIPWFCFSYLFVINMYLIFLFIIEKCIPSMFFIFINGNYLSCVFLCINDKYLSRVFLFVNENYLSCVFVPMMNICVLFFFLIYFTNKFLSCVFSFDI